MTSARLPIHDRLVELADPTRSRLLAALEKRELSVGELSTALQLPQSTVSRHLRILADQGWITARAEGANRWYRRHPQLENGMLSLWSLVRDAARGTPVSLQDEAHLDAVVAARRRASEQFFAAQAQDWDAMRSKLFGQRADLRALPALLDHSLVIGDLGCGTGSLTAALAPHVTRVHAIDGSAAMLAIARTTLSGMPNVHVAQAQLEELPLEDNVLDLAVLMLVLHHVVDPPGVLREVHRVLRPGGRVLITDMRAHANEQYRQSMGHVWLGFARETLDTWLREAGFDAVQHTHLPVEVESEGPALFTCTATMMPKPIMTLA